MLLLIALLAAEDELLRGQRAFQQGDFAAAEQAFRAQLKLTPQSAEAMSNLAAVLSRREQYAEAIGLYERAIKANPRLTPIRFNLAVALLKAGRPSDAAGQLELFLAAHPQENRARILLGASYVEAGEFAKAIAELEKTSDDPAARYSLAVAHARAGDDQRATQLLSALPPAAAAQTQGWIEYRRGRFAEANERFQEALRLEPNNAGALAAVGRIALLENRDEEAMGYFERALKLAPYDAESTYQLGVLYDRNQRTAEGRSLLERALVLRAHYADPHYQLARIDFRQKLYASALRRLQVAVRILPEQDAIRLLLGQTYKALGRGAEAEREFAEVRRIKAARTEKSKIELIVP